MIGAVQQCLQIAPGNATLLTARAEVMVLQRGCSVRILIHRLASNPQDILG